VAVVTVSDTRTAETDRSGPAIRSLCEAAGLRVADCRIVRDEPRRVGALLRELAGREEIDAVILNGGTGLSRRDRTYEAVTEALERRIDGFGELFRALSYEQIGAAAMLSRAVAGVVSGTAVFSLPGSEAAVRLAMDKLILPELGHIVGELRKVE
jgi:molybdenum cofactor biosynthesis protein B